MKTLEEMSMEELRALQKNGNPMESEAAKQAVETRSPCLPVPIPDPHALYRRMEWWNF